MKQIALLTDLKPRSDRALDRAALIADATGAGLDIVHAIEEMSAAAAEAARREAPLLVGPDGRLRSALALGAPVPARWTLLEGDGAPDLAEHVGSGAADLIVAGTGRDFNLSKIVLGSTVDRIVAEGARPALVVKRRPTAPYRLIAAAFDGSPQAGAALKSAIRSAPGARLAIVHSGGGSISELEDRIDRVLADMKGTGTTVPQEYELIAGEGGILEAMMAFERTGSPDLAAFGRTTKRGRLALVPGSNTQLLLAHLTCDTLVGAQPSG